MQLFFCVFEQMQWLRKLLFEPFRSSPLTRVVLAAAMCSAAELLALRLATVRACDEQACELGVEGDSAGVHERRWSACRGLRSRTPRASILRSRRLCRRRLSCLGADRGPAGRWEEARTLPFNWRHWLAALPQETFDRILQGHGVLAFGCRPIVGTTDPLPSTWSWTLRRCSASTCTRRRRGPC